MLLILSVGLACASTVVANGLLRVLMLLLLSLSAFMFILSYVLEATDSKDPLSSPQPYAGGQRSAPTTKAREGNDSAKQFSSSSPNLY